MKLVLICLLFSIGLVAAGPTFAVSDTTAGEHEWWQNAVFYQIYPRSFKDSDGDGIGDLNGIRSKLQYIKDLGVTAVWLSPIYKSPMVDTGYDISDFRDISPDYGTLKDFDDLLLEAKKLGIKIVLDFVPNHSSDLHEWFQKSINGIEPYTDYYIWADGKMVNGTRQPPSNWVSEFSGSAWEWNDKRQKYYLHQFAKQQPDLNYRNPKLVEEMKDVLRFWMDRGVSGFRVDTIPSLFEIDNFLDEPKSGQAGCKPTDYCYLNHIYTKDQPLTFDMVVQWRDVLKQHSATTDKIPRVIMTEAYSPIDVVMGYYGNATHDGASFTFNFQLIMRLRNSSNAVDFKDVIDLWIKYLPNGRTSNWVLGNHDQHRVTNRIGVERADALNMMTMTLPGVGVSYNGEEIGMEDGFVPWEDTQDPQAILAGPDHYLEVTRDPERTPFQWDASKNAGFSTTNNKTWLPVSDKYKETNVDKQQPNGIESHLHVYQDLLKLRKETTLLNGDLKTDAINQNVLTILRTLKGEKTFLSLLNLGDQVEKLDLSNIAELPSVLTVRVASVGARFKKGSEIKKGSVLLNPHEAYVLSG